MKVIVARHAETEYNVLGLFNSNPKKDTNLTKKGISQAKKLAKKLKSEDLDLIFVSELIRTWQTAEIINQFHGVPVIADARLNDIRSGFDDLPVKQYSMLKSSSPDPFEFCISGGESPHDVYSRTLLFIDYLKTRPESSVLIITSSHNAKHFFAISRQIDPRRMPRSAISNATFFSFEL